MMHVRTPAVAGSFYPAEPHVLNLLLDELLAAVPTGSAVPKALIAPHAGYIYSGPVAASGYATLAAAGSRISRVVLLGPAHHKAFRGLAAPSDDAFRTPLGDIPVDRAAIEALLALPQVRIDDEAHRLEHSLEVQLPFLQHQLQAFTLVPLVVGEASAAEVAAVLEQLWGGDETLIVISSDLSHYLDYDSARQRDRATTHAIETLDDEAIDYHDACGRNPVSGLLRIARNHGASIRTLDLRNSGDTAGPRDRVVGYGSYLLTE